MSSTDHGPPSALDTKRVPSGAAAISVGSCMLLKVDSFAPFAVLSSSTRLFPVSVTQIEPETEEYVHAVGTYNCVHQGATKRVQTSKLWETGASMQTWVHVWWKQLHWRAGRAVTTTSGNC